MYIMCVIIYMIGVQIYNYNNIPGLIFPISENKIVNFKKMVLMAFADIKIQTSLHM